MQKRLLRSLSCFFLLPFFSTLSLQAMELASLELTLDNPKKLVGTLHVALYKLPENLPQNASWETLQPVTELARPLESPQTTTQIMFHELTMGSYGIRLYLDENGNSQLDMSEMGIPKEAVGFANNPSLFSGMPNPQQARFDVQSSLHQLKIKLFKRKPKQKKSLH